MTLALRWRLSRTTGISRISRMALGHSAHSVHSAQENRGLGVAVPDDPLQFGLELDFRLGDEEAGEGVDGEGEILGEGGTSSSKGRGHHRCLGRAGLFGRYSDSERGRGRGRERMMSVRAIRSGAVIKAFFYGF